MADTTPKTRQGAFFPPVPDKKVYKPDKSLRMIKEPLAYEVRKIQMLIRACDRKLYEDPSKINLKDYTAVLELHTTKLKNLKSSGYTFKKNNIEGEDDEETVVDEISVSEAEETISEGASSSVDLRISAEDTFTP